MNEPRLFESVEPENVTNITDAVVKPISYQRANRLISERHYLHSMGPPSVANFGMEIDGWLAGAMTFGTIPGPNARGICGEDHAHRVWELTRLYCQDWIGKNAESYFIGQVFGLLKQIAMTEGGKIILSYADSGAGHVGTIYQATNWVYTGESVDSKVVGHDGTILHGRVARDPRKGMTSAGMERIAQEPKHRYLYFIGNKSQVKRLKADLRWPILPYPEACRTHGG